jgi:hypothetical protein
MAGERKIYHVVKFVQDLPSKVAATGKTVYLPTPSYYIGKNKYSFKPYEASKLTLDLAQKISSRYSEKNPTIEEESAYNLDEPILTELHQVGEEPVPPPPAPSSIAKLEQALRDAMAQLSKIEVLSICNRVVVGDS